MIIIQICYRRRNNLALDTRRWEICSEIEGFDIDLSEKVLLRQTSVDEVEVEFFSCPGLEVSNEKV